MNKTIQILLVLALCLTPIAPADVTTTLPGSPPGTGSPASPTTTLPGSPPTPGTGSPANPTTTLPGSPPTPGTSTNPTNTTTTVPGSPGSPSTPDTPVTPVNTTDPTTPAPNPTNTSTNTNPADNPAYAKFIQSCLDNHNIWRRQYNVPDLVWNQALADGSARWSQHMADTGSFSHSGVTAGENLAMGTNNGYYNEKTLIGLWVNEKKYFIPNCIFPNCSTTGSWKAVGHWTQMIWRKTYTVGCGTAVGRGKIYLTCRYVHTGNYRGQRVY